MKPSLVKPVMLVWIASTMVSIVLSTMNTTSQQQEKMSYANNLEKLWCLTNILTSGGYICYVLKMSVWEFQSCKSVRTLVWRRLLKWTILHSTNKLTVHLTMMVTILFWNLSYLFWKTLESKFIQLFLWTPSKWKDPLKHNLSSTISATA